MGFDAREIKLPQSGQHLTSTETAGLRIQAHVGRKTWTYRYRSPLDQKLRQVRIGTWAVMSSRAAVVAWELLRDLRDSGRDPAVEARADRVRARRSIAEVAAPSAPQSTVEQLCEDYWQDHVLQSRAKKGLISNDRQPQPR